MIGKPFVSRTDKRQRLARRSDTAPLITFSNTPTTNQKSQQSDNVITSELDPLLITKSNDSQLVQSDFREQKYFTKKQRGCSPPSNIKYRIRHKSPAAAAVSDCRRKLSDTSVVFFERKSKRSRSVDQSQQLPMSEATLMKFSRSLSKRMPRSGSAKNLMELSCDATLVWSEGKLMQKEINELYTAIEKNNVKSVETLLTAHPSIVNTYNNIDLTPLDVAMLCNYSTVAKRLIEFGGRNNEFFDHEPRILLSRLTLLAKNCATQLLELCGHIYNSSGTLNRDVESLESLNNQLKMFKTNLEQMKPGSPPRKVTLEVAGLYSLLVTVYPPSDSIVTRYKIEWSRFSDFSDIDDEIVVRTQFPMGVYQLCDLAPHVALFVKVSSINLKGVGPSIQSVPSYAEPSCWTESVNCERFASGISRRCAHRQEWCPVKFDINETHLEQQLQFWLATIKGRNNAVTAQSNATHESMDQKRYNAGKKSLLKSLFTSSIKFIRQPKHGLYIALVYKASDNDRFLTCGEEQLPFVMVDEEHPILSAISAECIWLMRLLANKPDLKLLVDVLSRLQLPSSVQLRGKLIVATCQLQMTLGCRDLGLLYPCVIHDVNYSVIILTKEIQVAKQLALPTGIKWSPISKLTKNPGNINDSISSQTGLDDELYSKIETFISFFRRNNTSLDDGLYLGYVRFKSTMDQLYIQQNIFSPTIFPVVKIRDNRHVDKDEWNNFLALKFPDMSDLQNSKGSKLQSAVIKAWQKLQVDLKLKPADSNNCRLYLEEILWLKKRVSVILIVPSIEEFCGLPGREIDLPLDYEWVSLHAFEYYHFHSHLKSENHFSAWASLHSTVEVLVSIAQQCLRQGFDQHEIDQCKERLEQFQSIQNQLDQYWRGLRWSVDVISNCRDKQLSNILTIPTQVLVDTDPTSQTVLCTEIHCPETKFPSSIDATKYNHTRPNIHPNSVLDKSNVTNHKQLPDSGVVSANTTIDTNSESEAVQPTKSLAKGTIRVYAGYPCGLLEGTSVKLLLNSHTTSADVIKLIVTQLNVTSITRNPHAPQYSDNDFKHFCLVVTIDNLTRPLPDNFHPLLLKQPWKSGKLTVKLK